MPAFYAGKRVGKPLLNGHTYNALFNGKLVWPLDRDTVVSIEITDDKGKPLPKSLAVSGTVTCSRHLTASRSEVGASCSRLVSESVSTGYSRAPHGSRKFFVIVPA